MVAAVVVVVGAEMTTALRGKEERSREEGEGLRLLEVRSLRGGRLEVLDGGVEVRVIVGGEEPWGISVGIEVGIPAGIGAACDVGLESMLLAGSA